MIDFADMEAAGVAYQAAVASLDATDRLVKIHTDRVARQLIDHVRAGRDVHVMHGGRDGYITPDQAQEILRSLLDSVSPKVRAEAESALRAP